MSSKWARGGLLAAGAAVIGSALVAAPASATITLPGRAALGHTTVGWRTIPSSSAASTFYCAIGDRCPVRMSVKGRDGQLTGISWVTAGRAETTGSAKAKLRAIVLNTTAAAKKNKIPLSKWQSGTTEGITWRFASSTQVTSSPAGSGVSAVQVFAAIKGTRLFTFITSDSVRVTVGRGPLIRGAAKFLNGPTSLPLVTGPARGLMGASST